MLIFWILRWRSVNESLNARSHFTPGSAPARAATSAIFVRSRRAQNDRRVVLRLAFEMSSEAYFRTRFAPDPRREVLWRALWRYHFFRLVSERDCVLELGAGYGHFINQVAAKRRIALDSWDEFVHYLQPGIESRIGSVTDLSFLQPSSVNFVFASNVFEHISQEDFASVLRQLKSALVANGTLNILQPNYRYSYREYFDDYTHQDGLHSCQHRRLP